MQKKDFELLEKYASYLNRKTGEFRRGRLDYVGHKYDYPNLDMKQIETALKAGFKLAEISVDTDYHGSHANEYSCWPVSSIEGAKVLLKDDFCHIALEPSYSHIETPLSTKNENVYSETVQLINMVKNDDKSFVNTLINSKAALSFAADVASIQNQINEIILNKDVGLTFSANEDYKFFDYYSGDVLSVEEAINQINSNYENGLIDLKNDEKDFLLMKLTDLSQYEKCDFEKDAKDHYKVLSKADMSIDKMKQAAQKKLQEINDKKHTDKVKEKQIELQK